MSPQSLPPELERLIERVLEAADLPFTAGRAEVETDLRAHLEDGLAAGHSVQDLIERFGDPEETGRRIARTRPRAEQQKRGEEWRWWMVFGALLGELKGAVRRLRKAPGFAAIVVVTLALGVGANTAIFTVLNAVMLEGLPYPEADRLVRVYESSKEFPDRRSFVRAPILHEWRSWDEVFESVGSVYTYREVGADLWDGEGTRRVIVSRVSAGFFETLGVQPALGRTFDENASFGPGEYGGRDDAPPPTIVISHHLRTELFPDRDPIGSTLELNGQSAEVIGVMPPDFENPFGSPPDAWVAADLRLGGSNGFGNYYLSAVARLRDGVSLEQVRDRASVLSDAIIEANPAAGQNTAINIQPLQADVVGSTRKTMLLILAGAAGLVLLTACLNVANLLFARGLGQDRDFALRSALGAGRKRLVGAVFAESAVLSVIGGLTGLVVGWAGVRSLLAMAPDAIPTSVDVQMSAPVFMFAFGVTGLALLLSGLAPAVRVSKTSASEVLRAGDRSSTVGRFVRRIRDSLVVIQIAMALVLVAGAGLLTKSFARLSAVDLVVEPEGVLTFEVHLPNSRYPDGASRHAFHEEFSRRIAEVPGVVSESAVSWLPVNGRYHSWGVARGSENISDDDWTGADTRIIHGDYFETMGIGVLEGAGIADVDLEGEPVVWVSESLAATVYGEDEPIGQQLFAGGGLRRVVGVVQDVPYDARGYNPDPEYRHTYYMPHRQYSENRNWALIRTVRAEGDLASVRDDIRAALAGIDGQLVLYRPQSFEGLVASVRAQDRFATALMGAFAALAVILSVIGTYGVLARGVAGRTREFGIRMALGADRSTVRGMVLRYAAALTVPGVVAGLIGAWAAGRWIEALLFDVEANDPLAFLAATVVFAVVGFVAAMIPARRATRVDAATALSAE